MDGILYWLSDWLLSFLTCRLVSAGQKDPHSPECFRPCCWVLNLVIHGYCCIYIWLLCWHLAFFCVCHLVFKCFKMYNQFRKQKLNNYLQHFLSQFVLANGLQFSFNTICRLICKQKVFIPHPLMIRETVHLVDNGWQFIVSDTELIRLVAV